MGHFETVPPLVKQIREVRREHELAFEMVVGAPRDLLRYNLKNVVSKSAARQAVEKASKEPYYEVSRIYSLIEQEFRNLKSKDSSSVEISQQSVELLSTKVN